MTATHSGAVLMLHALMQDARSGSEAVSTAPGSVFVSQRTTYLTPFGSVYVVPLPAGHCGPEGVGLDDGEEDVIVDCIEIALVVGTEEAGEDEPVIVPPDKEVA